MDIYDYIPIYSNACWADEAWRTDQLNTLIALNGWESVDVANVLGKETSTIRAYKVGHRIIPVSDLRTLMFETMRPMRGEE